MGLDSAVGSTCCFATIALEPLQVGVGAFEFALRLVAEAESMLVCGLALVCSGMLW